MSIFILVYAIGVGRLVWREIFQNNADTQRETFPAITTGMTDATLAGGGTGHIRNRGNEDRQACGRAHLRSRKHPATKGLDSSSRMPDG